MTTRDETTVKKNIPHFVDYVKAIKDYAVPMVGIVFAILNIYLSTKLSPVISDIRDIVHRVEAVEQSVASTRNSCESNYGSLSKSIENLKDAFLIKTEKVLEFTNTINARLSRIEGKIE